MWIGLGAIVDILHVMGLYMDGRGANRHSRYTQQGGKGDRLCRLQTCRYMHDDWESNCTWCRIMWMDVGFDNQPAVGCLSVATTATNDLLVDGHNLVASARVHISSVP